MEVKYNVGSSVVSDSVRQVEVDGKPAELVQKKLIVELTPVDPAHYGSLKLVVDPDAADLFKSETVITATFTADKE